MANQKNENCKHRNPSLHPNCPFCNPEQVYDGDWVYPNMNKPYYMYCCDCGLAHKLIFKIIKNNNKSIIGFQAFRDEPKTKKHRKQRKINNK